MKTTAAIKYIALADASSVGWIRTWIAKESPVAMSIRNRKNLFNAGPPSCNAWMMCVYVFYMNSSRYEYFWLDITIKKPESVSFPVVVNLVESSSWSEP
jgi:hypothetical protein